MMSAQSNSPIMQANTPSQGPSLSPAKTKMSLTMLSGYILAALFLIGVVVLIVLYVKKPCSGSDPSPDPGPACSKCTIAITDSDGKTIKQESCGSDSSYICTECTDCKTKCTATGLLWNNNECTINSDSVCPDGNGLQWNNNKCTLASDWSDIDCPAKCKLEHLCPLGTWTSKTDKTMTQYDPRREPDGSGIQNRCFGSHETFNNDFGFFSHYCSVNAGGKPSKGSEGGTTSWWCDMS